MTGGVAPGWYPDYEAPAGHQRYWDGLRWTDQRSDGAAVEAAGPAAGPAAVAATLAATATATRTREPARQRSSPEPEPAGPPGPERGSRVGLWLAGLAAAVLVGALVLVISEEGPALPGLGTSPPPASAPRAPSSGDEAPNESGDGGAPRTWEVASVVEGTSIELANGAVVRLAGLDSSCSTDALARLVDGQRVTLIRKGADKDREGRLLRYVERDGLDVGLRLIQRGYATASSEPNPRGEIYRKVDARSPSTC